MAFRGYLKLSTQVTKTIVMIDSSDHVTGKTGLTITKYLTKAGGTPTSATMTTSELDSTNTKGLYSLVFTTSHTDTLGEFALHGSGTGADPMDDWWEVVTYLPGEAVTLQTDQAVNVTKVNGTSQTARDLGASVLLSNGTGTGQVKLASGYVAMTWADVAAPTTAVDFSNTTIKTTQKVDVETIKTNPVVNGGTITFPSGATLASTTNITAGIITTVTNLTNAPTAGDFTATMKTSIGTAVAASAVASVTAGVTISTNNDKTGYSLGSNGLDSGALTAATKNAIADSVLDRNMATGTDSGTDSTSVRTPRQAFRVLRNKASIALGVLTVTKEDDSTASWTAAVTTAVGNPLSAVDPT